MRLHSENLIAVTLALCAVTFSVHAAGSGQARTIDRSGTWEFLFPINFNNGENIDFDNGTSADISNDYGLGFGVAYNNTRRLALGFNLSMYSANFKATRIEKDPGTGVETTKTVGGIFDSSTISFDGIYYFSDRRVSPFVSGTLGWLYLDTNIPSGPPEGVCWWDPLWQIYRCGSYVPTHTTNEFVYGAGLGLRFDITDRFFLRGSVNEQWVDFNGATSTTNFTVGRIDVGISLR
jgi:hypothetical protein